MDKERYQTQTAENITPLVSSTYSYALQERVEPMLSKIKSMFSGKHPQEDVLDASKAQRENFKKLAEDNKDIVSGFEFCAP